MPSRKQRNAPQQRAESRDNIGPAVPPLPRGSWWLVLALATATIICYAPAFRAPFLLDDAVTVEASAQWHADEGMPTAGRPLVMATLAANYRLNKLLNAPPDGPNTTVVYHAFNVGLHLLTGALLFLVLRRAMRERPIPEDWRAVADPLSAVVTTLWLLHPIQSEVIDYVVQRSEGLASFFYLATLYASLRAWDTSAWARFRWYALAVLACFLGMLSKEIVITAPLAVILYDRAFRLPSWRSLLSPGQWRGLLYTLLWITCITTFAAVGLGTRGRTAELNEGVTWYGYLYTQCWAITHYLRLVVWPNVLSPDYGFRTIHGARGVAGAVLLAAFGIATIVAWTRTERLGWFAFAGSMFFILLAPSSSVVPVVLEVAAERRIYLALAAVLVLAVVGAEHVRRRSLNNVSRHWVAAGIGALAILLTVTTARRSYAYTNPEALWREAVRAVPQNSRAHEQLALALLALRVPKTAEAESAFVHALAIDSSCQSGCLQYGSLLSKQGRFAEAIPLLARQAAQGEGTRYNVLASRLLALDLMRQGNYAGAIPHLKAVVRVDPTPAHLIVLGVAYLSAGHRDEAIAAFQHVTAINPGDARLQQLSQRLVDGVGHPEALANLQDFAFSMTRGWM